MTLSKKPYGTTLQGRRIERFILDNAKGLSLELITYGGIITSFTMPDRLGRSANIVLGFDSLEPYLARHPYFGALIGRVASRIAEGSFYLEGREYKLACNEKPRSPGSLGSHLHGGRAGFDKAVWEAKAFREADRAGVKLSYDSPDGEEGYPGALKVTATYSLSDEGVLDIEYRAESDKPTPVNLTNHSYWNLGGAGSGDILNHLLQLYCPFYLPADERLIPTGEILSVKGTPMDFLEAKPIGRDLERVPGGYDHYFTAAAGAESLRPVARVVEPESGRGMEIWTTLPGIQLYTGNFLDGIRGAGGAVFNRHAGLCLETTSFPDAVNRAHFPSCILQPGQTYRHLTRHRFFLE